MIYLDNASTTEIYPEYLDEIVDKLKWFGNPSNHYKIGFETKSIIEKARKDIANSLNCSPDEIYFTSGSSEGNAWSLKQRKRILCSPFEHHSIQSYPDSIIVGEDYIENALIKKRDRTDFIGNFSNFMYSHMLVNNIDGEIFDLIGVHEVVHEIHEDMLFHSDCTQALGKIPIDFSEFKCDIATFSGHKFHIPRGIGFNYFNKKYFDDSDYLKTVKPLIYGSQESELRGGTENSAFISVLGMAVKEETKKLENNMTYIKSLKQYLMEELNNSGIDFIYISPSNSIHSTLSFCIKDIESELIQSMLSDHEIYCGVGSACNSGEKLDKIDPTLQAKQIPEEYSHGLIRVSFSIKNKMDDVFCFVKGLKTVCFELGLIKED